MACRAAVGLQHNVSIQAWKETGEIWQDSCEGAEEEGLGRVAHLGRVNLSPGLQRKTYRRSNELGEPTPTALGSPPSVA